MTTTVYGTMITPYFEQRLASLVAQVPSPGPLIDFTQGVLVVGDGDGVVPPLSSIIANNGVLNEVWTGETIAGVTIDAEKPNQIDILCVIPSGVGGVEIGPFTVREFAIYEKIGEDLHLCVVGTTDIEKTVAAQGQTSDVIFIAAVAVSATTPIIMTDPSAYFATMVDVRNQINANRPTAQAPILIEETTTPTGWIRQIFKSRPASQPATPSSGPVVDTANTGHGRPATQAEFDAGASLGGFAWPWATLAQIKAALDFIVGMIPTIPGVVAPITYDAGTNRYGAAKASAAQVCEGASDAVVVTPAGLSLSAVPVQLSDQASIAWNMATGYNAAVTLAGNRTLAAPTNARRGVTYSLLVTQDATGGRTLGFHAAYKWGAAGAPALSTGAGKRDLVTMMCVSGAPNPEFVCTIVKGF